MTVANSSPVPVGRLPGLSLRVEDAPVSMDVSAVFEDPDDDVLTYAAESSAPAVVSVSGRAVTVTGVSVGSAEVRVTAADAGGSGRTAAQALATMEEEILAHPYACTATNSGCFLKPQVSSPQLDAHTLTRALG